ncbi:hypothetical protein SAMN04488104_103034 [Algoriphagus faecimaris]|uniref:Uncharacterized protein n=1 Tax=Algoriphagus faecimaris TaxID=686796 RepID=A0A1G6UTW8_9BACT|nr:hypothetical protein SAMN04488104_103034 [Algoriphagus faecimaris]
MRPFLTDQKERNRLGFLRKATNPASLGTWLKRLLCFKGFRLPPLGSSVLACFSPKPSRRMNPFISNLIFCSLSSQLQAAGPVPALALFLILIVEVFVPEAYWSDSHSIQRESRPRRFLCQLSRQARSSLFSFPCSLFPLPSITIRLFPDL